MTNEDIHAVVRDKIEFWLKLPNREGTELMWQVLVQSDYFQAPGSTTHHNIYEGGLAKHSLDVAYLFAKKCEQFRLKVTQQSAFLVGILHDLCKINYYEPKTVQDPLTSDTKTIWVTNDQLPLGHGEKSALLAQRHMELTYQELALIRWHMIEFEKGGQYTEKSMRTAINEVWPECIALHTADFEAAAYCKTLEQTSGWLQDD